jgi:hypothetical protein
MQPGWPTAVAKDPAAFLFMEEIDIIRNMLENQWKYLYTVERKFSNERE